MNKQRLCLFLIIAHSNYCYGHLNCPITTYDTLNGTGATSRNALSFSTLTDERLSLAFPELVNMNDFAMPQDAAHPIHNFCGTLTLNSTESEGFYEEVLDVNDIGVGERLHLPPISQEFVQHGSHLIPVIRSRQDISHPRWDFIISPGRVWNEDGDEEGTWSRASFPFALVTNDHSRQTYNGVMTFVFRNSGEISNVAYQIAHETSYKFRGNFWGIVSATFNNSDSKVLFKATPIQMEYEEEVAGRIPVKDLTDLELDHGIDSTKFRSVKHESFRAFYIDGIAYAGGFMTRTGIFPYPESLVVVSHSIGKAMLTTLIALAMEQEFGNVLDSHIVELIEDADEEWTPVTIENALDMSTGMYKFKKYPIDDYFLNCRFFDQEQHPKKLEIALTCYNKRKSKPGKVFAYHSSDYYVAAVALRSLMHAKGLNDDLVEYYNSRIIRPLRIGNMTQGSILKTLDETEHIYGSTGLFFTIDDVLKLSRFINPGYGDRGKINGEQILDPTGLDKGMQNDPDNRGVCFRGDSRKYSYKLGFWAREFDFPECPSMNNIPIAKGLAGSLIAFLPNNTTYTHFSSSLLEDRIYDIEDIAKESIKIRCL